MAIIGVLVAIPVTLLVRGGDDTPSMPPQKPIVLPTVGDPISDSRIGVEVRIPHGWKRTTSKRRGISLQSSDRSAAISITAPAKGGQRDPVLNAAIASIKGSYDHVRVGARQEHGRMAGLHARSAALAAVAAKKKRKLRVLVSAADGKRFTYLVEVFTAAVDTPATVQAQTILNNMKLVG